MAKVKKNKQNKIADKHKYQALDGKWGWMIVLGASLGHFFLVGLARTLGVFFVYWKDNFQGTAAATAWVQSLFNTVRMVSGPFVSMLCDIFGPRVVVMVGGFIYGSGCLISAFATSLEFLYLSFSLVGGLGAGCLFTTMFVMVSQYFDKKKGVAMALASIGAGLGTIVLAALETVLLDAYGNYGAMMIISGLMFNCIVVGALFRPIESKLNWYKHKKASDQEMEVIVDEKGETEEKSDNYKDKKEEQEVKPLVSNDGKEKEQDDSNPEDPKADAAEDNKKVLNKKDRTETSDKNSEKDQKDNSVATGGDDDVDYNDDDDDKKGETMAMTEEANRDGKHEGTKSKWAQLKTRFLILKSVTFWIYCFYIAALPCVVQIYLIFTPPLMKDRGFTENQVALVISIAGAADMAGRFISGFIFDLNFIRHRRWPTHTIYAFIVGIIVLFNAFQHHLFGFITMALLWGIFEGGYHSQRATIMSEFITREQVSSSVGFMIFWQGIGNMVSPTFAGFLRDKFGSYTVSFYYGGTTMMVCSFAFFINYLVVKAKKKSSSKNKKDITVDA